MSGQLPEKIIEVRDQSGSGLLGGLIRFLPPEELEPALKAGYRHEGAAVPFAITAFGDILTWEKDNYICKVSFRHNRSEVLASGAAYFFEDLEEDSRYASEHFETELFAEAVEKLGALAESECYGFVPLEEIGGSDVTHIKKVQYREYLLLLIQFTGGIDQL